MTRKKVIFPQPLPKSFMGACILFSAPTFCVCIDKECGGAGRRNTEIFLLYGYLADQVCFLVSFKI